MDLLKIEIQKTMQSDVCVEIHTFPLMRLLLYPFEIGCEFDPHAR